MRDFCESIAEVSHEQKCFLSVQLACLLVLFVVIGLLCGGKSLE